MTEIKDLEEQIKKHKALYYSGEPEIADHEYDQLEEKLKKLNPESAVLKMVGTLVSSEDKVKHDQKMLSLNKTYKIEELDSWQDGKEVVTAYKIDGMSCSLIYESGKLVMAKTRGDGQFGENILSKVLWIDSVPKELPEELSCEIRGEVYCSEEQFISLSNEMTMRGFEKPSSQRNIVAGLMGRKENVELARFLEFFAFDLITQERIVKTEWEKLQKIERLGFVLPEVGIHKDLKSVKAEVEKTKNFMAEGEYLIDGLVITYNKLALHEELGSTAHHPRYRIAFKFQGESKVTKIKRLEWSISRNGIYTPVANVEPIELSGAMISRVTLHNYGMAKQYDLKAGDEIEVIRSGEVIPKFLSVVNATEGKFDYPKSCEWCDEDLVVKDIRLFCVNSQCPGIIKESILNFVQKIGIDDLSSKRLNEMLKNKLIQDIPDLYKLTIDDLMTLDKVKDKLATKLIDAINKSKQVDLTTFLSALGISGGAYNKCEKVVNAGHDTIDKIKSLTAQSIQDIDSFAEKSATEFYKSLSEKFDLIDELMPFGFDFKEKDFGESQLIGKKICITGALTHKRADIEKHIRDKGGVVVGSVSKKTDFLVTNEKEGTSSKFKKAIANEIPIINEEKLFALLGIQYGDQN